MEFYRWLRHVLARIRRSLHNRLQPLWTTEFQPGSRCHGKSCRNQGAVCGLPEDALVAIDLNIPRYRSSFHRENESVNGDCEHNTPRLTEKNAW